MNLRELKRQFESIYKRPPTGAVRAPGRVNLIGEHTDYNDGFVLPIAIERETVAVYASRGDMTANFASMQSNEPAGINLGRGPLLKPGKPEWANYCIGVAAGLFEKSVPLVGADILFSSTVPIGGGLSSSASLEVATAFALLGAAGWLGTVNAKDLAVICQNAEHKFANTPCGIMDQAIAIMGQAGRALLLDCRFGTTRQIPFDNPNLRLLVVDTKVKHENSDGGYAARRQQCEAAAQELAVKALRDADEEMLSSAASDARLPHLNHRRARHVVREIRRTLRAAEVLEAGDYRTFGELMYESHASLRDDYEVSCAELDEVVEIARTCPGVYGARMTGGGFGGCAIILAEAAAADAVSQKVASGFLDKFGHACPIFATAAAAGASVLE